MSTSVSSSPATGTPLKDICQIAIRVVDLARARAYYRDVLRLPFLFDAPNLTFFQAGTVRLMLSRAETAEFDHPGSVLYFTVANIEDAYRTLKERGVSFRDEPHVIHTTPQGSLWITAFEDSEANVLALMEMKTA